jgi:toxin FitB
MLLDTNIIIYATNPQYPQLLALIGDPDSAVSLISYVEALGFHRLSPTERATLERFFRAMEVLPIPDRVAQEAIRLRQQRKMGLGDSIIAGTALVHGHKLVTRNAADFAWIPGLEVVNPLS